jgi:hypothetical protein
LLSWSLNLSTKITATPTAFGLTAAQATAYAAVHATYATALAACDPTLRNKSLTAAKNAARTALKTAASQTVNLVNGTPTVTDSQKISLGITPRAKPTPIPQPSVAPGLDIGSVSGWTVRVKLHDKALGSKRGKPAGVSGASVFSFVGATPPNDMASWKFEGNTGRTVVDIVFDTSNVPGAKVWLTAFWFNGRKQSGPPCSPVSTNLQGGSVSMAA